MSKKILLCLSLPALLLALAACQRSDGAAFVGTYTYKMSGQVAYQIESSRGCDTLWVNVGTEQGQMNVVERSDDDLLLTFNALGGDVSVADAEADDDMLTLRGRQEKCITLLSLSETELPDEDTENDDVWSKYFETLISDGPLATMNVSFRGFGGRYDDILLLDIYYEGTAQGSDGMALAIIDSRVQCVAKRNE